MTVPVLKTLDAIKSVPCLPTLLFITCFHDDGSFLKCWLEYYYNFLSCQSLFLFIDDYQTLEWPLAY